jgi:hypothetical protein
MDIPNQKTQYSGSKEPQKDWVLGKRSGKQSHLLLISIRHRGQHWICNFSDSGPDYAILIFLFLNTI